MRVPVVGNNVALRESYDQPVTSSRLCTFVPNTANWLLHGSGADRRNVDGIVADRQNGSPLSRTHSRACCEL